MFFLYIIFLLCFFCFYEYLINCQINSVFKKNTQIKTLIRSCARWALASLQDKSPLIAILHANYGAGYLWALKEIFTDYEIYRATGIDIIFFTKKITDIQDLATKRLTSTCPEFINHLDYNLLKIAGEI
jgi:hypothetical protein